MNLIDTVGTLAGILSAASFLPQVLKVWRLKSTQSISRMMYILYCLSIILWSIYAWMIDSWPLLATEIVTGVMAAYILFMTCKKSDKNMLHVKKKS